MAYLLLKVPLPRFASFPCKLHNYFAEITIGYFADLNSLSVFLLCISLLIRTHICACILSGLTYILVPFFKLYYFAYIIFLGDQNHISCFFYN